MSRKSNTEEFIEKCQKKYGDIYDYSKVNYETAIKEVLIGHVFSRYKWNYIEAFSLEKARYIAFETPSTFLVAS